MSPDEFRVLRVFETADTAGMEEIRDKLGISTVYAEYLCNSLSRKGYLEALPNGQYQLATTYKVRSEHLVGVFVPNRA